MQQNILLYSEAKTARPFWWSSLDFWVVWAFSRLTTSEDWPFRPLRGLKGQISGLSASLRPGQPRNLARQPKKSCCFSSLYNKIPFLCTYFRFQDCVNWRQQPSTKLMGKKWLACKVLPIFISKKHCLWQERSSRTSLAWFTGGVLVDHKAS